MDAPAQAISSRRAQLVARLAAERSALLLQLEGVDETALTHDPVFDSWTAAGLLAHVAYWDAVGADRLAKLGDGRRGDIQPIGDTLDSRNAALSAHVAGLGFPEAVARCQKERRNLLSVLDRLPDDVLYRRVRLRSGWRAIPSGWVRQRHRHDAEHTADLTRWRAGYPPNPPSLRVIHRALLQPILGLSRREFLALAALVSPDMRESQPVTGEWTLKQIVGHIAQYEELGVLALKAVAAGREPAYETLITDFDAYNGSRAATWAEVSWGEAWAAYLATRRALLLIVETLPDEALTRPFPAPWPATTTACGYLLDMAQHEREHADALRPVLGLRPLPHRLRPAG